MAKAKKGDLIRVVQDGDESYGAYKIGDIIEVDYVDEYKNGDVTVTTNNCYLYDEEFEIFRKAGEEDSEPVGVIREMREQKMREYIGEADSDAVEHPNHYTQGRFETIEVIEEITQGYSDVYVAYCVGNALKYLARAPHKHETPLEDLRKAAKYLEFAIDRLT